MMTCCLSQPPLPAACTHLDTGVVSSQIQQVSPELQVDLECQQLGWLLWHCWLCGICR